MKIIGVGSASVKATVIKLSKNNKCTDLKPVKTYSQYLKAYGLDIKTGKK